MDRGAEQSTSAGLVALQEGSQHLLHEVGTRLGLPTRMCFTESWLQSALSMHRTLGVEDSMLFLASHG